ARRRQVRAVELVVRLQVVVEDVLAGLQVAALALVAEPTAVGVVLGVAAGGGAVARRVGVDPPRVAVLAARHRAVQAVERPVGVVAVVVEAVVVPGAGRVALVALVAERALVQRVLVAPDAALLRRVGELVVLVALVALDLGVAADQRPGAALAVHPLDALLGHAEAALGRVALEAGLHQHPLAVLLAEHRLVLRQVGELAVVDVLVPVAAHAALPVVGRLLEVLEVVRLLAAVAVAAVGLGVLAAQREAGVPAVVELGRAEARLRVAGLARRHRPAELGEPVAVRVV